MSPDEIQAAAARLPSAAARRAFLLRLARRRIGGPAYLVPEGDPRPNSARKNRSVEDIADDTFFKSEWQGEGEADRVDLERRRREMMAEAKRSSGNTKRRLLDEMRNRVPLRVVR